MTKFKKISKDLGSGAGLDMLNPNRKKRKRKLKYPMRPDDEEHLSHFSDSLNDDSRYVP